MKCAAPSMVARAFGATYPRMVAATLGPNCPDVPAALQALRERAINYLRR